MAKQNDYFLSVVFLPAAKDFQCGFDLTIRVTLLPQVTPMYLEYPILVLIVHTTLADMYLLLQTHFSALAISPRTEFG